MRPTTTKRARATRARTTRARTTRARTTLSKLTDAHLARVPAWRVIDHDAEDQPLEPAEFDASGAVAAHNLGVWCLCRAVFADGSEHPGCAMVWADGPDVPGALTVSKGSEALPIYVPPAPSFVLKLEGPKWLARKLNRALSDIFPIRFTVVPRFAVPPKTRQVIVYLDGRRK